MKKTIYIFIAVSILLTGISLWGRQIHGDQQERLKQINYGQKTKERNDKIEAEKEKRKYENEHTFLEQTNPHLYQKIVVDGELQGGDLRWGIKPSTPDNYLPFEGIPDKIFLSIILDENMKNSLIEKIGFSGVRLGFFHNSLVYRKIEINTNYNHSSNFIKDIRENQNLFKQLIEELRIKYGLPFHSQNGAKIIWDSRGTYIEAYPDREIIMCSKSFYLFIKGQEYESYKNKARKLVN